MGSSVFIQPYFSPHEVRCNVLLAPFTTVKIGGPAELFAEPTTTEEFIGLVQRAREYNLGITILGRGANVLIADEGIPGLVIRPCNATYERLVSGAVRIGAGMDLGALVQKLVADGFAGSEQLIGVPGTLGGAVYGNAGKGEAGIGDFVSQVQIVDRGSGTVRWINHDDCMFAARRSAFQKNSWIVVAADCIFPLDADGTAREQVKAYLLRKVATQPLQGATWGCTFRNVAWSDGVGNETLHALMVRERAQNLRESTLAGKRWLYLLDERKLLPASWLLDRAGCKGWRIGQAVVSDRHANFILNEGGAKASEARALIETMRTRVRERFGVVLENEVMCLPPLQILAPSNIT